MWLHPASTHARREGVDARPKAAGMTGSGGQGGRWRGVTLVGGQGGHWRGVTAFGLSSRCSVMAGLVPAIHVSQVPPGSEQGVDAGKPAGARHLDTACPPV